MLRLRSVLKWIWPGVEEEIQCQQRRDCIGKLPDPAIVPIWQWLSVFNNSEASKCTPSVPYSLPSAR
ncbi:hypothetical protein J6590_008014 [Homalodisca vitripennis]|nr:hypothetical protein J6590_008014 [Homalodisca vitripennis]